MNIGGNNQKLRSDLWQGRNKSKPVAEMTRDEINRELAERLGLCWHFNHYESDPGKVMLLREMRKKDTYINFVYSIRLSSIIGIERFICDENSGFLAKATLDWLRKVDGDN